MTNLSTPQNLDSPRKIGHCVAHIRRFFASDQCLGCSRSPLRFGAERRSATALGETLAQAPGSLLLSCTSEAGGSRPQYLFHTSSLFMKQSLREGSAAPPRRPARGGTGGARARRRKRADINVFEAADEMVQHARRIVDGVGVTPVPRLAGFLSSQKKASERIASTNEDGVYYSGWYTSLGLEHPRPRTVLADSKTATQPPKRPQPAAADPSLSQGNLHLEVVAADLNDLVAGLQRTLASDRRLRGYKGLKGLKQLETEAGFSDAGPADASTAFAQPSIDVVVALSLGTTAGFALPSLFDTDGFMCSSRDVPEALSEDGSADPFIAASVASQATFEHATRCQIAATLGPFAAADDGSPALRQASKRFWEPQTRPFSDTEVVSGAAATSDASEPLPPREALSPLPHHRTVLPGPAYVSLHRSALETCLLRRRSSASGAPSTAQHVEALPNGGHVVHTCLPSGKTSDTWISSVYHGTRTPSWRWPVVVPIFAASPDTVVNLSVFQVEDTASSTQAVSSTVEDVSLRLVASTVFPIGRLLGGGVSALAHHGNVFHDPSRTVRKAHEQYGEVLANLRAPATSEEPASLALQRSLLLRPVSSIDAALPHWNESWTALQVHPSLPVHISPPPQQAVFEGSVFHFPANLAGSQIPADIVNAVLEGKPLQLQHPGLATTVQNTSVPPSAGSSLSRPRVQVGSLDALLLGMVFSLYMRRGLLSILPPSSSSQKRSASISSTPRDRSFSRDVQTSLSPAAAPAQGGVSFREGSKEVTPGPSTMAGKPSFALCTLQLHPCIADLAPGTVAFLRSSWNGQLRKRAQEPDALVVASFPPALVREAVQERAAAVGNSLQAAVAAATIRASAGRPPSSALGHVEAESSRPSPSPMTPRGVPQAGQNWLKDSTIGPIVKQPFSGVPAYSLTLRWRFEVDAEPAASRGARLLSRIGVRAGDALASLPSPPLRLLALACEATKSTEVSRHLPVLEPLFRHVTEVLEKRRHADWRVMADASQRMFDAVLQQDVAGGIPRVLSTPADQARGGTPFKVRGGSELLHGMGLDGSASFTSRPATPAARGSARHRSSSLCTPSAASPVLTPGGAQSASALACAVPAGVLVPCLLARGGSRTSKTAAGGEVTIETGTARESSSRGQGIRKFEFVGIVRQLTEMNEVSLGAVFDHMDSNSDGTLSFDEYISFLLAEADSALSHRLSQDCYLLQQPSVRDANRCVRVDNGGSSTMLHMPEMQGYAMLFSDNQLQVWDDTFSLSLFLDARSSTCPMPPAYCLPLTEAPHISGLLVHVDDATGQIRPVQQAEGVASQTLSRSGATKRDVMDAQDRFRSDLRAQRAVMGVVIDAGSLDTRGRYRRSSMSGQYLRDALATSGGRQRLQGPIRPGTADAGTLASLRATVPAHLYNTYYHPAHTSGDVHASPLGFTASEAFANPVTVEAASRIVAQARYASDPRGQTKDMLAFMSNTAPNTGLPPRPHTTAGRRRKRKGGAGMGKQARLASEEEPGSASRGAGQAHFSAATEAVLSSMTPPITAIAFDGNGPRRVLLVACADRHVRVFDLSKYRADGPLPLKEVVRRRRHAASKKRSLKAKVRAGLGAGNVDVRASSLASIPGMEAVLERAAVRAGTGKDATDADVSAAAAARAATVASAISSTASGVKVDDAMLTSLLSGDAEVFLTTPTSRLRHAAAMVEPLASLERTEALVSVVFGGTQKADIAHRARVMGADDPARSLIPLPGTANAAIGTVPSGLYRSNPYMGARLRRRAARRKQQVALLDAASAANAAALALQEANPQATPVGVVTLGGQSAQGADEAARVSSMHLKSAAAADATHARSHKAGAIISNAHMSASSMLDGGRETAISAAGAMYVTGGLMASAQAGGGDSYTGVSGMSASALAITNAIQKEAAAAASAAAQRGGRGGDGALSQTAMAMMAAGRSRGDKLKSGFIGVGTELSQGTSTNVVLAGDAGSGGASATTGASATNGAVHMSSVGLPEPGVATLACSASFGVGPGIPQCMCVIEGVPYIAEPDGGDTGVSEGADLGQRSGSRGGASFTAEDGADSSTDQRRNRVNLQRGASSRGRRSVGSRVVQSGVPTGTLYAVGDSAGYVGLYTTKTFVRVALIRTKVDCVTCLLHAPGVGLIAAGMGGPLCVIDVVAATVCDWDGKRSNRASKKKAARVKAPKDRCLSIGIRQMVWCDTERCIISVGHDRRVLVWDPDLLESGPAAEIGSVPHSVSPADTVVSVAVNDAHRQVITLTAGGRVQVWDPRTLRCLQSESDAVGRPHMGLQSQAQAALSAVQDMALGTTLGDIMGGDITGNSTFLGDTLLADSSTAATAGITRARGGDVNIGTSAVAKIAAATAGGKDSKNAPGSHVLRSAYDPGTGGGYFGAGVFVDILRMSVVVYGSHARAWSITEVDGNETPAAVAAARYYGVLAGDGDAGAGGQETFTEGQLKVAGPAMHASNSRSMIQLGALASHAPAAGASAETVTMPVVSGVQETALGPALADTMGGPGSARSSSAAGGDETATGAKLLANVKAEEDEAASKLVAGYDADDTWMAVLFAAEFERVVGVKSNGRVVVWDIRTGAVLLTFRAHHGRVSKDSTKLVSKQEASGSGGLGDLSAASLDGAGRRLVTSSITGTVRLWNVTNGALVRSLVPHGHELSCVAFHASGQVNSPIVAGAWDGTLLWWEDDGELNEDVSSDEGESKAPARRPRGSRRKVNKYLRYRTQDVDEDASIDAITAATMARLPGEQGGLLSTVDDVLAMAATAGVEGASTMRPDSAQLKMSLRKPQPARDGARGEDEEQADAMLGALTKPGHHTATSMSKDAKLMLSYFNGSGAGPGSSGGATAGSPRAGATAGSDVVSMSQSKALSHISRRSNTEALQAAASVSQRMRTSLLLTLSEHERARRVGRARGDVPGDVEDEATGSGDLLKQGRSRESKLAEQIATNSIIAPGTSIQARAQKATSTSGTLGTSVGGPRVTRVPVPRKGVSGFVDDAMAASPHSPVAAAVDGRDSTLGSDMSSPEVLVLPAQDEATHHADTTPSPAYQQKAGIAIVDAAAAAAGTGAYSRADVLCIAVGGGSQTEDTVHASPRQQVAPAVAVAPWVSTGSADGLLVLWNPNTFKPTATHRLLDVGRLGSLQAAPVTSLVAMPHAPLLLAGTANGCLHVLSVSSGRLHSKPVPPETRKQSKAVVTVTSDGHVRMEKFKKPPPDTSFCTSPLTPEWSEGITVYSGQAAPDAGSPTEPVRRSITAMAAAAVGDGTVLLAVGYDGGFMRLYDVSRVQGDAGTCLTSPLKEWRPHVHSVAGIQPVQVSGAPLLFLSAGGLHVKLHRADGSLLVTMSADTGLAKASAARRWPRVLRESDTAAVEIAAAVRRLSMLGGGEGGEALPEAVRAKGGTHKQHVFKRKVRLLAGTVRRMSSMAGHSPGATGGASSEDASAATVAEEKVAAPVSGGSPITLSPAERQSRLSRWMEQRVDSDLVGHKMLSPAGLAAESRGQSIADSAQSHDSADPQVRPSSRDPATARSASQARSARGFSFDRRKLQSRREWLADQVPRSNSSGVKQRSEGAKSGGDLQQSTRTKGADAEFWRSIAAMEEGMVIPPPSRPRTVLHGLTSDRFDIQSMETATGDSSHAWMAAMSATGHSEQEEAAVVEHGGVGNSVRPHSGVAPGEVDGTLFDPSIDLVGDAGHARALTPEQRLPLPPLASLGDPDAGGFSSRSASIRKSRTGAKRPHAPQQAKSARLSSRPGSVGGRRSTVQGAGGLGPAPLRTPKGQARPALATPTDYGGAADKVGYEGELVTSATNFSQWTGQPGVPMVPKHARIPYEYLGKARWRRLPINSPRNTEGWGALRQELQNREDVRSRMGLREHGSGVSGE